jgi:aminopeptidase N
MLRRLLLSTTLLMMAGAALAQTPAVPATTDPAAPRGKLPDAVRPAAYRLDMTILPERPRFSGHVEIDVDVKAASDRIYMHGRELNVTRAVAVVGGQPHPARWTQVDPTGVVRLDFAAPLPAGRATLVFDYDAPFGDAPSGLYHIKVADRWYSWTQFESIDARAAYPSFDEPGYKTPFTVSITTAPGQVAVSNAPEAGVTRSGPLEVHHFQPTRPLPTYLVAMVTGPFQHLRGAVPPDAERSAPLPLGVVASQAQAGKTDYVLQETPRIVGLLEGYFGQPFPFPKLDQIASPEMPGAMENAGADVYADPIIMLDRDASTGQRQEFGMVVAHELSHQWFGDLVSPAWWDDIWLNESFANWMGYRIGDAWRPELKIHLNALAEGFSAMRTDALEAGRPIHQHIAENSQIDSAFDSITYGKGGQVIAMIAAYMGDEQFRSGVRLHLQRHAYGNASTDQFFGALADAAHDPRILQSMRSFVDQPGVPLVSFQRQGGRLVATQSRYALLDGQPAAERWTIPVCISTGAGPRQCTLLDQVSAPVTVRAGAYLMPNAGGTGYYRFDLPASDWRDLIAALPTLDPGEALATDDSLWASFAAGRAPASSLLAETRAIAANESSSASASAGDDWAGYRARGLVADAALPAYRRFIGASYGPRLRGLGLELRRGAYSAEAPDRQKLRQSLAGLLAREAEDPGTNARLAAAAKAYLAGEEDALDQSFRSVALAAYVRTGGVPAAQALMARALASEDADFRGPALGAIVGTGRKDVAQWVLGYQDARLRPLERLNLVTGLARAAGTRDLGADWLMRNYDRLAAGANGIFVTSRLPSSLSTQCSVERADEIERELGPKVRQAGAGGVLDFERTVEQVRRCGQLKAARQGELTAALEQAGA